MSKEPYITVTEGMSGHFAVMLSWNPDMGGFWEPYQTGIGRYREREEAAAEAREWAEADGLKFHDENESHTNR
jgi:hypothetical protein